MHLTLSRVEEKDFDELLEVQFRAFSKVDIHTALFGHNTKEHRDLTKARFLKDMKEDSSDVWMKLVDESTGKIISGAQWKVYPTWAPPGEHPPFQADWFEGEERKAAEDMCNAFMQIRGKYQHSHAHVLLYILFTDPDFQRCGAGSIHVKWGTELADRLLVPCWVEGSPEGHHLYEENGFKDIEYVKQNFGKWVMEFTMMRRESKKSFEAGRSIVFS